MTTTLADGCTDEHDPDANMRCEKRASTEIDATPVHERSDRLRSVTFLDYAPDPENNPAGILHGTLGLLLNDTEVPVRVPRRFDWSVANHFGREALVTFLVHPDDVTMGRVEVIEDDTGRTTLMHTVPTIGGLSCLTSPSHPWEIVETYRPDSAVHVVGKYGALSPLPTGDKTHQWVRATIQVDEVHVTHDKRRQVPSPTSWKPSPVKPSWLD